MGCFAQRLQPDQLELRPARLEDGVGDIGQQVQPIGEEGPQQGEIPQALPLLVIPLLSRGNLHALAVAQRDLSRLDGELFEPPQAGLDKIEQIQGPWANPGPLPINRKQAPVGVDQ